MPVARTPTQAAAQRLTFRVADRCFAVPAAAVREVVRPPRTTRVPHAPDSLIGLANLRGNVLPVVALATLIDREATTAGRVIVLERENPVGLLVDEVSGVVENGAGEAEALDLDSLLAMAFSAHAATRPKALRSASQAVERDTVRADEVVLLAFALGRQEYALPIGQIDEVMTLPNDITLVPKSGAAALGTVARHGRLLPLLSLRSLLGLPSAETGRTARVLIARIGAHTVGLVVDAVRSILRVAESEIDPVPVVLSRGGAEARIQAICRTDGGSRLVSILATENLLQADLTNRLLQGSNVEGMAMADKASQVATEQFLIFRVGEQDFGMPIAAVREVASLPGKLTRIPRAPAFVEGLMSLRGQVIPVIDQGRRFDGDAVAAGRRRVIVTEVGGSEAGFLVDQVSEVRRIPTEALGAAPEFAGDRARLFVRVANLEDDGRMILIVEPRELLDSAERDLLAAMAIKDSAAAP